MRSKAYDSRYAHSLCFPRADEFLQQPCPDTTRDIVRLRRYAVLDLRTRRIVHGYHIAGRWRDWRGGTLQAHVDKVTNTEGTAADRAIREARVVHLNRGLEPVARGCISEQTKKEVVHWVSMQGGDLHASCRPLLAWFWMAPRQRIGCRADRPSGRERSGRDGPVARLKGMP